MCPLIPPHKYIWQDCTSNRCYVNFIFTCHRWSIYIMKSSTTLKLHNYDNYAAAAEIIIPYYITCLIPVQHTDWFKFIVTNSISETPGCIINWHKGPDNFYSVFIHFIFLNPCVLCDFICILMSASQPKTSTDLLCKRCPWSESFGPMLKNCSCCFCKSHGRCFRPPAYLMWRLYLQA